MLQVASDLSVCIIVTAKTFLSYYISLFCNLHTSVASLFIISDTTLLLHIYIYFPTKMAVLNCTWNTYLFHICALNGYLNSHNKTNKCTYISHIIHYWYSVATTTILIAIYKITRSAEDGCDDNWNMLVMNNVKNTRYTCAFVGSGVWTGIIYFNTWGDSLKLVTTHVRFCDQQCCKATVYSKLIFLCILSYQNMFEIKAVLSSIFCGMYPLFLWCFVESCHSWKIFVKWGLYQDPKNQNHYTCRNPKDHHHHLINNCDLHCVIRTTPNTVQHSTRL